jgi:hypothetical protein
VCDPAGSSYGPGEWDQPCTLLTRPIQITAKRYHDAAGKPYIDFSPALRFVPGKAVMLYLYDPTSVLDGRSVIEWCSDGGLCVVEDSPTQRNVETGILHRQIKHFSGYMISSGRTSLRSDL